MKLTISILCVFLLIVSIGAPPVVENDKADNKKDADTKTDNSDEVVKILNFNFVHFN